MTFPVNYQDCILSASLNGLLICHLPHIEKRGFSDLHYLIPIQSVGMIGRLVIILSLIHISLCLAATTFAAGNQPTTAKWEGNINVSKLGKYLKLNTDQSEEVANICDYFSTQMSRATTATVSYTHLDDIEEAECHFILHSPVERRRNQQTDHSVETKITDQK